jgi:Dyp-type peroxidase family
MPTPLTPMPVSAAVSNLEVAQIQGDILIGLQKLVQRFVFFEIANVDSFKSILRQQVSGGLVTTTQVAKDREQILSQSSGQNLSLIGVNIGFSNTGMQKLIPGADLGDSSFGAGAKLRAIAMTSTPDPTGAGPDTQPINDPSVEGVPSTWDAKFLGNIDGVFIITGGSGSDLGMQTQALKSAFGTSWLPLDPEDGQVRPGSNKGHEHFGWLDGISQPAVNGLVVSPFPGQDVVEAGHFVFGYPKVAAGASFALPQPWMKNGSFMVFRKLQQLVPEFTTFINDSATASGVAPELLGARMVGRWKSGAPVSTNPTADNAPVGDDSAQNNNFDFATDQSGQSCPFSAHIRKTNPRSDLSKPQLDARRVIRQGIPYGPEVDPATESTTTISNRGLLFVCYQTSILSQFEFLQGSWANNPDFICPIAKGANHADGTAITTGIDPIIGQPVDPTVGRTPDSAIPTPPGGVLTMPTTLFIKPLGGGYFFMPSISALANELTT